MGERTEYTPGTFCWSELTTSDQDAAKAFYGPLLGWQADDIPVGDGAYYSMQLIGGKRVAAIAPQPQQQRDAGVPPLWKLVHIGAERGRGGGARQGAARTCMRRRST